MKNIPLFETRPVNNVRDVLNSSAQLYRSKTAFLVKANVNEGYSHISYEKFKDDVDAFGTILHNLGLKGKRIAIISENRYEWSISYMAIINGTGIAVPLDKELPENELESLINRSKVSAIIFSGNVSEQIANISRKIDFVEYYINMDDKGDNLKFTPFDKLLKQGHLLMKNGNTLFMDTDIDLEAMCTLLFTSGTTDTSKAVMLSQKNITTNLIAMSSMLFIGSDDIFLSILPIHHTYECTCGFLCPIYRGASVAFCEGLRHILKNLQESKATVMLGVPLIHEAMYKRIWEQAEKNGLAKKLKVGIKLSNFLRIFGINITKKLFDKVHESLGGNMRLLISGAAGIDPAVAKGFRSLGFLFVQGYGLSECSPIVALNRNVDFKDNAAGLPLPNLDVKIDSPGRDGIGEIIVKGPSVMLGYYEDPEANKKVFKNGYFYTGDAGYIDSDGFIHITGRKKNVIITKNGKNIYPEEIESLLNKSPYIKESLVFGKTDQFSGDMVVACTLVPDMDKIHEILPGVESKGELVKDLLQKEIKAINKGLVIYKHIKHMAIQEEEFAKTTTKKIKRYLAFTKK